MNSKLTRINTNNKNQCNAYNAYNAYNGIKGEKRTNHCVRLRHSIHKAVKNYCHDTRMTIGQFYEEAAITYFQVNPPPENGATFPVIRESDINENGVEDKMMEIICIGDLENWLEAARPLINQGTEIHRSRVKTLHGIIKKCKKLNTRSPKLDEMLEEAIEYVI